MGTALLCSVLGTTLPVQADKISDLQSQKSQTQSQLSEVENRQDQLESQAEQLSGSISYVNEEIVQTMASIQILEDEIAWLDTAIENKQKEYDTAKAEEDRQYEAMKKRIKYMYEKGDDNYVQILLQAESISDLINKADYAEKLYAYDRQMLVKFQTIQEEVRQRQEELLDEKDEQEEAKQGLEDEKAALDSQLASLRSQYADVDARISAAQAEAAQLAEKIRQQNAAISAAIEEKAREEEAKRKAAEEEARRQQAAAEAAARAAAEAAASSSSNSSSSSTSSSSSSTTSTTTTTTTTTKVYASPSGHTGQDVVNYACQFVGNPYVYGGTSLTNGCDCSGFTQSVYKAFGYSLGRTDVAQRSNGIAVASLEEALPGDIICYPGHVALYCGNGTIVHASTARTGIKYSNVTYRAYVCIRRIIY